MQVNIQAAKTNLSKLIDAASAGEEVIIANGKRPVARIVPILQVTFCIGLLKGELTGAGPDFFEIVPDDELALWESAN